VHCMAYVAQFFASGRQGQQNRSIAMRRQNCIMINNGAAVDVLQVRRPATSLHTICMHHPMHKHTVQGWPKKGTERWHTRHTWLLDLLAAAMAGPL
jgi:hypothetical protein